MKGREGECEGITGKKDEEGEGCTPGVDGVVVAVAVASRHPAPPSPPLRELVVASPLVLASRRTSRRLPPGSDPEGRRCGFVPGRGGSGMAKPGQFPFRAVSNRTAIPGPTWLRTGPCRSGRIRPRSGPFRAKTNEALINVFAA